MSLIDLSEFGCSCLAFIIDQFSEAVLALLEPAVEASAVCVFTYHTLRPVKHHSQPMDTKAGHSRQPNTNQTQAVQNLLTSVSNQCGLAYLA